ncbi:MAG: ABC transporter permease [Oscillospiraceae bacterium]|jgi:spermidine/putrescine transport system permease protein|nr:ABC transporter permease [Oscillospiraceae bacterium]
MKRSRVPGRILQILVAVFLYAPILVLIVFSFNSDKSRTQFKGFTLDWYRSLFENQQVLSALYLTLILAVLSALIATVIGTVSAIGLYNMKRRPRKMLLALNNIPVVNPDIITGVSLMLVFVLCVSFLRSLGADAGLGFTTLLIAHVTFNIPYVILSVLPKLRQLSKHTYEAALDLGASPFQAYRRVILPEIMPGVVSGAMIAFTMSIDDFLISYFTTGTSVQTLPMVIYAMTRKRVSPEINALSTLMFVTVLVLLIAINVLQVRDQKRKEQKRS